MWCFAGPTQGPGSRGHGATFMIDLQEDYRLVWCRLDCLFHRRSQIWRIWWLLVRIHSYNLAGGQHAELCLQATFLKSALSGAYEHKTCRRLIDTSPNSRHSIQISGLHLSADSAVELRTHLILTAPSSLPLSANTLCVASTSSVSSLKTA